MFISKCDTFYFSNLLSIKNTRSRWWRYTTLICIYTYIYLSYTFDILLLTRRIQTLTRIKDDIFTDKIHFDNTLLDHRFELLINILNTTYICISRHKQVTLSPDTALPNTIAHVRSKSFHCVIFKIISWINRTKIIYISNSILIYKFPAGILSFKEAGLCSQITCFNMEMSFANEWVNE